MALLANKPDARTPRTRLPRDQRGQQLLDVAEQLFAARGFESTSMEDIAREAGVTRPVVYSHYATKELVFLACVRRARNDLEQRLRELEVMRAEGAGLSDVIERGGDIFFEILEQDPPRWAVLFSPSSALSEELAQQLNEARFQTVDNIISVSRHFLPPGDDERVAAYAHAISGVGEQLGRWWLANPTVPRARLTELYRDFIMRGLDPWSG